MSDSISAIANRPYVRHMGITFARDADGVLATMPFREELVGNKAIPALHGGSIVALLELAGLAHLSADQAAPPSVVGVTVEYLRPGLSRTTYARARVIKSGKRVANLHVEAWQDDPAKPIAALRGLFLYAEAGAISPK
jgi:uncharacterized protein (TIGR00369 family)